MKVKVLLFASLREIVGSSQSALDIEQGAHVADVWKGLAALYPAIQPHSGTIAYALNGFYAKPDEPVSEGDEIAFLPPVSGG